MDALVIGAGTLGVASSWRDEDAMDGLALAFAGYVLATPIVHAAHDRWGHSAISVGLRLLSPLLALGVVAMASRDPSPAFRGVVLIGGFAAPVILDAAVFAWEMPHRTPRSYLYATGLVTPGSAGVQLASSF